MTKPNPIRIVIVGARRGKNFLQTAQFAGAEVVGICDPSEKSLEPWKSESSLSLYRSLDEVLNEKNVDAICLATPAHLHAEQSIAALEAGFHVLCEVPAIDTLDEASRLVEAVEKTGRTYMMAENYCYRREILMVQNMLEKGLFGELTFASGSYIHDCRDLYVYPDGTLTWRGERRRKSSGNSYPTHSMGPVCRWVGINRTDHLKRICAFQSKSSAFPYYLSKNHPDQLNDKSPDFFKNGDTCSSSIQTDKGVLIDCRVDWASVRPHDMVRYELQGTKGSFLLHNEQSQIWIEGYSKQTPTGVALQWDPLENFAETFEHPLWVQHGKEARQAGHGGGDYFTLKEFVSSIHAERAPEIDVYDAVAWSAVYPLSAQSIESGNQPVEFPSIARGKVLL